MLKYFDESYKDPKEGFDIYDFKFHDYSRIGEYIEKLFEPFKEHPSVKKVEITKKPYGEVLKKSHKFIINSTIYDYIYMIKITLKTDILLELNLKVPKLLNDGYFILNGIKKFALCQFIDMPYIRRYKEKSNRIDDEVRINNNFVFLKLSKLNDKKLRVPRLKIIHGMDQFDILPYMIVYAGIDNVDLIDDNKFKITFKNEFACLNEYLKEYIDSAHEDYEFKSFSPKKHETWKRVMMDYKNRSVKHATKRIEQVKVAFKLDFWNNKHYNGDPFINAIKLYQREYTDEPNDLNVKRVRFTEYILSIFMRTVFQLYTDINNKTKEYIRNESLAQHMTHKELISNIQTSANIFNPLSSESENIRITYLGCGGFSKDFGLAELRDIHDSYAGNICPIFTPDRESCGVVCFATNSLRFNEDGLFLTLLDGSENSWKKLDELHTISIISEQQPSLNRGDATRSQMSAAHMRQSEPLIYPEYPFVKSGYEDKLKCNYGIYRAKEDGEVLMKTRRSMIVKYKSGNIDIIDRDMYNSFIEKTKFKKDELLMTSISIDESLKIGKNMLVAFTPYDGYNFNDAIVISESASKKLTCTFDEKFVITLNENEFLIKYNDEDFLPKIGSNIKKGEIFCKKKRLSFENRKDIYREPEEYQAEEDFEVTDIEIYPQNINTINREYEVFIQTELLKNSLRRDKIIEALKDKVDENNLQEYLLRNKLTNKIQFKISENKSISDTTIIIKGKIKRPVIKGDKLANRHGNKGVVAYIVPDKDMLKMDINGKEEIVDIALNSQSVVSRMNVSQIIDSTLGMCVRYIKDRLFIMTDNDEKIKFILDCVNILDSTSERWYYNQTKKQIENIEIDDKFINEFYLVLQPFGSDINKVQELTKYLGVKSSYDVYNPLYDITTNIQVGYLYSLRLMHMATDKMHSRSTGNYIKRSGQPPKGRSNGGGQRFGEMEVWGLNAYNAYSTLTEFLTLKSDDPSQKVDLINNILSGEGHHLKRKTKTESNRLLTASLKTLGIELNITDDISDFEKDKDSEE